MSTNFTAVPPSQFRADVRGVTQAIVADEQSRFPDFSINPDRAFAAVISENGRMLVQEYMARINQENLRAQYYGDRNNILIGNHCGAPFAHSQIKSFLTRAVVIAETAHIPFTEVFNHLLEDPGVRCNHPLGFKALEFLKNALRAESIAAAEEQKAA